MNLKQEYQMVAQNYLRKIEAGRKITSCSSTVGDQAQDLLREFSKSGDQ